MSEVLSLVITMEAVSTFSQFYILIIELQQTLKRTCNKRVNTWISDHDARFSEHHFYIVIAKNRDSCIIV